MNTRGLLILVVSLCAVPVSAWALPCSDQNPVSYPLFCRGGNLAPEVDIAMLTGGPPGAVVVVPQATVSTAFTKGSKPAGVGGVDVASGSCAWVDRAFNASEPSMLQTFVQLQDGSSITWQRLSTCMGDSNCIFEMCAYNQNGAIHLYPFWAVFLNAN